MKKFLFIAVLILFLGCAKNDGTSPYMFQVGDVVTISDKVTMHPNYITEMKKYVGKKVTITCQGYRFRLKHEGRYYNITEDGGKNDWFESFLTLVKPGKESIRLKGIRDRLAAESVDGKDRTLRKKIMNNKTENKVEDKIEDNDISTVGSDSIVSYCFHESKVNWFWRLYEKAERSNKRSDIYKVWQYIYKNIPEVDDKYDWEIDVDLPYPVIWRNRFKKSKY